MKLRRGRLRGIAPAPLLVALASAVGLAGCGGSASTAQDTIITKAELIEKADTICKQTDTLQKERVAAYEREHPGNAYSAGYAAHALQKAALPPIANEIAKVVALGIPAGDDNQIAPIIDGWRRALDKVGEHPAILLSLEEGPFARPDNLAGAYGFKACSRAL
jgi:ABC-type glycerol-3-phosphate transport system substrate-binding protein